MSESIQEIIGKGYAEFWNSKQRYVVCKGSRASKKSTTAALKIIVRMMQYPLANTLVVRKTASTLKDSCFAQLKWAISRLGVESYWKARVSPLELEYIPTGQRIIFRGLDDSLKITSITVPHGNLCFAWLEEAYEVSEEDFDYIDESLRGQLPDGYYIQWLIIFNPWSASSWLKSRFFDKPNKNVLAMTTTYKQNEWLSEADKERFEDMKRNNYQRYLVAGEANWGIATGQYFTEFNERRHVVKPFAIPKEWHKFRAMDWGLAKPYAVLWFAVDYDGNLWCYRELYGWDGKANVGTGETAAAIGKKIVALEKPEENVRSGVLDSACFARTGVTGESIAEAINNELYKAKLSTFSKSSKGRVEGANALKQRLIGNKNSDGEFVPAIYFFSTCIHTLRTLPMLGHDKHNPETYDTDGEDHCLVAGTLIKTKRGNVPIENVTTDDYVMTRRGLKKVLASAMTKRNAKVMTVEFSNGRSLTGTGNHPVYIKGKGFIPLEDLKYGDIVCAENHKDKNNVSVFSLENKNKKADVYNLTVEDEHEYFANGILVHNCTDAICYACLARPYTPTKPQPAKPIDRYKPQEKSLVWTV